MYGVLNMPIISHERDTDNAIFKGIINQQISAKNTALLWVNARTLHSKCNEIQISLQNTK